MELNDSLYTYLQTVTALTDLIGNRIFPDRKRQASSYTYPYITYQGTDESEDDARTHVMPTSTLIESLYEFDIEASTRASAVAVKKQLKKAFKNFEGVMGGGVTISAICFEGSEDDTITDKTGKIISYRTTVEFAIWHYETA